jgi:hypothetical protein
VRFASARFTLRPRAHLCYLIQLCTIRDQKVAPLARLDLVGVTDICVQGYGAILMTSRDWIRTYKLIPSLDQSTGYFKFVPPTFGLSIASSNIMLRWEQV